MNIAEGGRGDRRGQQPREDEEEVVVATAAAVEEARVQADGDDTKNDDAVEDVEEVEVEGEQEQHAGRGSGEEEPADFTTLEELQVRWQGILFTRGGMIAGRPVGPFGWVGITVDGGAGRSKEMLRVTWKGKKLKSMTRPPAGSLQEVGAILKLVRFLINARQQTQTTAEQDEAAAVEKPEKRQKTMKMKAMSGVKEDARDRANSAEEMARAAVAAMAAAENRASKAEAKLLAESPVPEKVTCAICLVEELTVFGHLKGKSMCGGDNDPHW